MNPIKHQDSSKRNKRTLIPGIFLLMIWLSACAALSDPPPHLSHQKKHISPEVQTLLTLRPRHTTMNVVIWTDKKSYAIGDEIVFFFRTSEDSYLNLFDLGSSGKLRRIFPNKAHHNRLFKAEKIHRIPALNSRFAIQVTGPLGIEQIKAIATPEPWFTNPSTKDVDFLNISITQTNERESLRDALEKLKRLPWAEAQTEITIRGNDQIKTPLGQERQIKPKPPEKPIDITGTPGRKEKAQSLEKQTSGLNPPMTHSK